MSVPNQIGTQPHRLGKNVFQIWYENDRKVPFLVQASHWAKDSYFMVTHVEMSPKQWEYFEKTGNLYGEAFGFFYRRGERLTSGGPVGLQNPGVYKWRRVYEEKMRPFWEKSGPQDRQANLQDA